MSEPAKVELLLGEIKGRLDTYIAIGEAEQARLRRMADDHEDRITTLEAQVASARTLAGALRWIVAGLAAAVGWLSSHLVWSVK